MPPYFHDRPTFDGGLGGGWALALDRLRQAAARPKLLVSVRDPGEMTEAGRCGVDIVDLKEPRRGALAPTDFELWQHAASVWSRTQSLGPRPCLSAALGERPQAVCIAARLPAEFAFAKVGPSGCDGVGKLRQLWAEVRRLLDDGIELVAVAYADNRNARCIDPEAIFETAIDAGFGRCLIDTFVKDGRSTLDHLGFDGLSRIKNVARQGGLWWALAGSIDVSCVSQLRQRDLVPDCFALRGDVCSQGREGTLSQDRIQLWRESLLPASDPHSESPNLN